MPVDRPLLTRFALYRLFLVGLLLISYFYAWQPARNGLMEGLVYPTLKEALATSESVLSVTSRANAVRVDVQGITSPLLPVTIPPPAGTVFLLPAVAALLLAPRQPYWLLLWVGHVAVLFLVMLILVVGLHGLTAEEVIANQVGASVPAAIYVSDFLQAYVLDVFSIVVPVFAFLSNRDLRNASSTT